MSDEGKIRAFFALEIPPQLKARLAEDQARLKQELPPARWVRPDAQHVTLKFLGDVAPSTVRRLVTKVGRTLGDARRVTVALSGAGFFPSPARPRVAWLGGRAEDVPAVVEAVELASKECGFPSERRRWALHVTQARLRQPWPAPAVDRFLTWGQELRLESFDADEVILFQSDLQPGGAVYTPLERFPLR